MEAGRGAYCNPIHAHAHCVHAHQGRGLSERSCSLPQTRRRVEGKERVLPGEREREQGRASERSTHSCGRTAERHHVSFCLPALRTQIELLGDPALSFAHERTITGKLDRNTFNFLTKKMRLKIFA